MKKFIPFLLLVMVTLNPACQKDIAHSGTASSGPRTIRIYLTDDQTPVFDSVFIDLQGLEVKLEDDSVSHGGWVTLSIRPGIYNILRFRNGIDTLFASGTLPGDRIRKIRLTLGTRNSAVKNGQVFPLRVKDEDREIVAELTTGQFEITPGGQILFWIDFDAGRSIQTDNSGPGNGNGYALKSHIRIFSQSHSGRIEGRVLPGAAEALVMAISGTDTTMAIPDDDDGEFKIVGLNAGTYRVFFDGRNGYRDTTLFNILVRSGEDTRLPVITLHP